MDGRETKVEECLPMCGLPEGHTGECGGPWYDKWRSASPAQQPAEQTGPCGECHLQPNEVCDICGAAQTPAAVPRDAGVWAVLFEEAGKPPEVFTGHGAEQAARAYYADRIVNWSCVLLGPVTPAVPQGAEVEGALPNGELLLTKAREIGWEEQNDEGAYEYVTRCCYEAGMHDAQSALAQRDEQIEHWKRMHVNAEASYQAAKSAALSAAPAPPAQVDRDAKGGA